MESKYDTVAQAALYFSLFSAAGILVVGALLMKASMTLSKLSEDFEELKEKLASQEGK